MIDVAEVSVVADGITLLPSTSVGVAHGEALIIRGNNGTGKTTLLRVLAGIRQPSTGSVQVAGEVVSQRNRSFRRKVATMIGIPPMAPDLTVRDHVTLVAATWFNGNADIAVVAEQGLDQLGMASLGERFPHELSSGQTQLFGLCLVLARPFDVLILDEPEQRLDPERLGVVIDVLKALRDRGVTVVAATHSPVLAEHLGDRVLDLDRAS